MHSWPPEEANLEWPRVTEGNPGSPTFLSPSQKERHNQGF
jgi:hypothetical protein